MGPDSRPDPYDLAALWVLLPVLGAYLAHAPVLRYGWLPGLARPLDLGATLRGRRLLGDNKTWRGALVMGGGVVVATLLLWRSPSWWSHLPVPLREAGPLETGVRIGLGTVLAELPGSFLKRQLGIPPGGRRRSLGGALLSVWDQADLVAGVWLLLLPVWRMPARAAAIAFGVVALAHLAVSAVGRSIGARRTVW